MWPSPSATIPLPGVLGQKQPWRFEAPSLQPSLAHQQPTAAPMHSPRSAHLRRVNAPPFPPIHPPAAVLARTTGFSGGHTLPPNNNFNQGSLSARSLGAAPTTDHRGLAPPRLVVRPSHQGLIVPSHPPVAEMKPALPRYAENHSSTIGNKVASQVAGKLPPRGTPSTLSVTSRNSPATSETASVPSHTPIIQLVDPDKEKRKSGGSHSSQVSQPSTIQYQPEGPVTSALPHYSPRRGSRFEALFQDALNRQERQRVRKEERERVEEEELYRKGQSKTRRPFSMAKFKQCVDDDVRQRQERKARREAMRIQEKNNKDKEALKQCSFRPNTTRRNRRFSAGRSPTSSISGYGDLLDTSRVSGRRGSLSSCFSPGSTFGSSPVGRSPPASRQVSPRVSRIGFDATKTTTRRQSVSSLMSIEENMSPSRRSAPNGGRLSQVYSPRPSVASQLSPRSPSVLGDSVLRDCRDLRRLDMGASLRSSTSPRGRGSHGLI
ncbi:hypothetical protein FOZ63_003356 [Perkinsus olseni]|uniref:Uncharacterized protein n=2 Tax=Perkinsus olseni TaxID=32597 RepID=A0A7J6PR12_PEROL|nr:hypothetical protein FOZ63_003356 [Perkinsus olseni]